MLKEARFSFRHQGCWLQETTERHPGVMLVVGGIYVVDDDIHVDLLAHGPEALLARAAAEWARDPRIRRVNKVVAGPQGSRFHVAYASGDSIYPRILRHTPLSLGTVTMADGVEHYAIVGAPQELDGLMKELGTKGTLLVEAVRDLSAPAPSPGGDLVDTWLSALTDRQLEALLFAYENGYHRWPRSLSATELAERSGLSSSAFLDQLRRAEAKTFEIMLAELRARDPGRVAAVRARTDKPPRP